MSASVSPGTFLDEAVLAAAAERRARRRRALVRETLLALPVPVIVILMPLILAWLAIPVVILSEVLLGFVRRRPRAMLLRLALFGAIVAVAAVLPVKTIDRIEVHPLPTTPVTIAAFNAQAETTKTMVQLWTDTPSTTIVFSRPRLSLRDFADELAATTGRQASIDGCAHGGSILDGTDPGFGVMLER
jgi:hypothetical protein